MHGNLQRMLFVHVLSAQIKICWLCICNKCNVLIIIIMRIMRMTVMITVHCLQLPIELVLERWIVIGKMPSDHCKCFEITYCYRNETILLGPWTTKLVAFCDILLLQPKVICSSAYYLHKIILFYCVISIENQSIAWIRWKDHGRKDGELG